MTRQPRSKSGTAIEWTDATWNPATGCDKVSPGCDHCYAERIALRDPKNFPTGFAVTLHPERLDKPLHWREPRRIFVNSMSDLFHDQIPDQFIEQVWDTMAAAPQHTFQLLTKRPGRMRSLLRHWQVLPNVWLGVSAENQKWADVRLPILAETPAAIRFVSAEPLIGPISLADHLPGLDWVIVGGESGPEHRPMDPDWARDLRDQCTSAGVAFLFKQWGGRTPKAGGRELDGRTWDEYPDVTSPLVTSAITLHAREPVYATAAPTYWEAGWRGILPVDPADKGGLPKGFTGHNGIDVTPENLDWFIKSKPGYNIGLRQPADTIGIDVDNWGDKTGAQTIAEAEKRWGKLPYSPRSTSRAPEDPISGIRMYRIPPGVKLVDGISFPELGLGGVDIIQRHHRHVQCWPSRHPETGRLYQWYGIDGAPLDSPPHYPGDIPLLPERWLAELRDDTPRNGADLGDQPADPTIVDQAITDGEMSQRVAFKLGQALTELHNGACRHDATRDRVLGLLRCGKQGEPGVKQALTTLRKAFGDVADATQRDGGRERALYEFREFIYTKVDGRWVPRPEVAQLLADDSYDDTEWVNNLGADGEPPPDTDEHHTGEYDPGEGVGNDGDHDDTDAPTTWEPVDLGPWLRGEIEQPQPSIGVHRSDGLQLIYPGREHAFVGETESGKTWLAVGCVAAELTKGNHVVYIHYEEGDPASTIERLRLLGVDPALIASRLRFIAPARAAHTEWVEALLDPPPTLVVHDGVNEAMSLHGTDIMAADGAATFRRRLVVPFLRASAASIACDHLPKNPDGRGRDAYGSVHKGNALDGARIVLENVEPFGRRLRGVSHVFVTKDRPGQLRAHGRPTKMPGKTIIGTFVVDDSESYSPDFSMRFFALRDDDTGAANPKATFSCAELADIVHEVLTGLPDQTVDSQRKLFAEMRVAGHTFREGAMRNAVDDLLVAGRVVEFPGKRGATGYRAVLTAAHDTTGKES